MTKLKYEGTRVDYPTARLRAWDFMKPDHPYPAAWVADRIWPDHQMHAQGAGGAASRVLKRMAVEGLARWVCRTRRSGTQEWGWIRQGNRPKEK